MAPAHRVTTRETVARGLATLEQFIASIAAGDMAALESLLSEHVRFFSDGAGEFNAAIRPVIGWKQVAALFAGRAKASVPVVASELRVLNGLPALVVKRLPAPGFASRFTIQVEMDNEGRLSRIYTVLASRKLTAVALYRTRNDGPERGQAVRWPVSNARRPHCGYDVSSASQNWANSASFKSDTAQNDMRSWTQ
jgi:hypothetical protein